ncbi:MAG: hypothetical protein V7K50_25485 [Nostoc sp.]
MGSGDEGDEGDEGDYLIINAQYNSWRGCANDFSTRRYANAVVERSDALSVAELSNSVQVPNTSTPFDFAQGKSLSTSAQCPIPNIPQHVTIN